MQHITRVAVFATHPAHTDRRALSQAWYSALHLAERAPQERVVRSAPYAEKIAALKASHPAGAALAQRAGDAVPPRAGTSGAAMRRGETSAPAGERREPTFPRARRAVHAPPRRAPRGIPVSFAVRAANGGVHLLVHADGTRTRVVAVCATRLRERVERALAQARFALAGCGLRAEAA